MNTRALPPVRGLLCVAVVGTVYFPLPGLAQDVIPDDTLGAESSIVTPLDANTDRIDGGALRDAVLFHSFEGFSIPEGHRVYFANPELVNTIFSRVTGDDPSRLFGTLGVLGEADLLFLNPNGVLFGPNAELDLRGAFTATTGTGVVLPGGEVFSAVEPEAVPLLTVDVQPQVGIVFEGETPGAIVNSGDLVVPEEQGIALIGGVVVNDGTLTAPTGQVSLAAVPGNSSVQVGSQAQVLGWDAWTSNNANSFGSSNPLAGNELVNSLGIHVSNELTIGTTLVSGEVDASSPLSSGGTIQVLGDRVALVDGTLNASGLRGGGTVLVGGEYQGQGALPSASQTYVGEGGAIVADALQSGNGGDVIVWADETADIHGILTARGGSVSGNGGFIETSGRQFLNLTSTPDASAPNGNGGTWLIDPTDITLANGGGPIGANVVDVANINAALNMGSNVTISTGIEGTDDGNITQDNDAAILKTAGGEATLSLQAIDNIALNADIASINEKLNIELIADSDNSGIGAINITNADIDTNNGVFTGFGIGLIITNNSNIRTEDGDITLTSNGQNNVLNALGIGIDVNSVLESTAGNITLTGTGGNGIDLAYGLTVANNSNIRSHDGDITLIGTGGNNADNVDGIGIVLGGVVESTGVGTISLIGTGGTGGDAQGAVFGFEGSSGVRSVDGDIVVIGTANGDGISAFGDHGILVFRDGFLETTGTGNIILNGTGGIANTFTGIGSNNAGIWIEGELIASDSGDVSLAGISGNGTELDRGIELLDDSLITANNGLISLDATGGVVLRGAEMSSDFGGIFIRGRGLSDGIEVYGIGILEDSTISTETGDIRLEGIGGDGSGSGHRGILARDSQIFSSGSGNVNLRGIGGNTSGENNDGIVIINSLIQTQDSASIFLDGRAGEGSTFLEGILIAFGTRFLSQDGDIELSGVGGVGGVGNSSDIENNGIALVSDTVLVQGSEPILIESTGLGNILLSGVGGSAIPGPNSNQSSRGIFLGGLASPTRILSNQGNISLIGHSENGELDTVGMLIRSMNIIESNSGDILLEGFTGSNLNDVVVNSFPDDTDTNTYALSAGDSITTSGVINMPENSLQLNSGGDVTVNDAIRTSGNSFNIVAGGSISIADEIDAEDGDVSLQGGGEIQLDDINAATLEVISAGRISGEGILSVEGDASFTTTDTDAGTVRINNTESTILGSSLIGGNFSVTSADPVAQSPGEPLQVAGAITVNGAENGSLISTVGVPEFEDVTEDGDVIKTGVGNVVLNAQTVTGDLIVNSIPIGVVSFDGILEPSAITLENSNNAFGGTLRFRTAIGEDAAIIEGTPGITQAGPITVVGTTTLNAASGNILLAAPGNEFGALAFNAAAVRLAEQDGLSLLRSQATGDLSITTGGLLTQSEPLAITGTTEVVTTLSGRGDVALTNTTDTRLGQTLIGGDFTLTSSGEISPVSGTTLQFPGDTNVDFAALGFDQNALPPTLIALPDGDVVVTAVGPIELSQNTAITNNGPVNLLQNNPETTQIEGSLTVNSLAEALQVGEIFDGAAIQLADSDNRFEGPISVRTDADTIALETGTPAITQSESVSVRDTATFNAVGGDITLAETNNQFGLVSFDGNTVTLAEADDTVIADGTVTGDLSLSSGGIITQLGSLQVDGTSRIESRQADADIILNNSNRLVGDITLITVGNGDVVLSNSLDNTRLAETTLDGDLTVNSGGAIEQSGPLRVTAGTTTLNAGSDGVLLDQANDFNQLVVTGIGNVTVEDINDINLGNSATFGDFQVTAADNIITQDISTSSGDIQLISSSGEIDTTGGLLSTRLPFDRSGDVLIEAPGNVHLGDITASGFPSGSITLVTDSELTLDDANVRSILFGPDPGGEISVTADRLNLLNGGRLRTSTNGDGDGSDLIINARELRVQGIDGRITGLGTDTRLGSSGSGGDIRINENIEADLIEIVGIDPQDFNPDPEDPFSLLTAALLETGFTTATLGTGRSGDLTIANTSQLNIRNGAGITTASLAIELPENADALPEQDGRAGTLSIDVESAEFSGAAGLASATLGPSDAGRIDVNVDTVSLSNGATLSADAIESAELIQQLPDNDLDIESGLDEWLEAVQNNPPESIGLAGDINVSATEQIVLDNRGRISTSSSATSGGNIFIDTGFLSLRHGDGVGGIFTQGGLLDGEGDGGRIAIIADSIIANQYENTDISAEAYLGTGGGIEIEVGFRSGIEFRNPPTPRSDITTFSELGDSGIADVNDIGFDPTQGLQALPEEPQGPEAIEGCAVSANNQAAGFFDLGRGGKLPGPEDFVTADTIIAEWIPLELADANEAKVPETNRQPYLIANCGVED